MSTAEFDAIIVGNADYLKPFAFKFTKHKETAEDLVQETLCKALANRQGFAEDSSVRAWLFTIMRNIFINYYRKQQKYHAIINNKTLFINFVNRDSYVATSISYDLEVKQIQKAINALPVVFKKNLLLHLEGFKYREIASIVGEPIGTVKSRIHFAKRILKEAIDKY